MTAVNQPSSAFGSPRLGRPADALPVEQEAVAIRRELAQANPDRYRPDLAQSLNNLAGTLAQTDRPAETEGGHVPNPLNSGSYRPSILRTAEYESAYHPARFERQET